MASSSDCSTSWSLIVRAQGDGAEARAALGDLVRRYERTILCHVQRLGHPPDLTAEDVKQDFLNAILRRRDIDKLRPGEGGFRSWLSMAVRNHLSNAWDHWKAQRRGSSLTDRPEHFDIAHEDTPERLCLCAEALDTLDYAMKRQRDETEDKARFDALKGCLPSRGLEPFELDSLAAPLGLTRNAVAVRISRMQNRFARIVFEVVADTLDVDRDDPAGKEAVVDELRALEDLLGTSLPPVGHLVHA